MIALVALVDEHPTEIEYEVLVRLGRRLADLGTDRLGWRELYVLLHHAPEDSPIMRARAECGHSPSEHLSLLLLHSQQVGNWQRSHGKKSTYPKLPQCLDQTVETSTLGRGERMTLDEAAEWLGWDLPAAS